MVCFKHLCLTLIASCVAAVIAQEGNKENEQAASEPVAFEKKPQLKAAIKTTFPDAEYFGLNLINGRPTRALIEITNQNAEPISLTIIGGALHNTQKSSSGDDNEDQISVTYPILRNLSSQLVDIQIPVGQSHTHPYSFALDMTPQDVKLRLLAIVKDAQQQTFQIVAHEGNVTIVDPPTSIFDPQILFLYLFLTALLGVTLYFVWQNWLETIIPLPRWMQTGTKKGKRAEHGASRSTSENRGRASGFTPASGFTNSKEIDESWIPSHHLNKPVAKRPKGGSKAKTKVTE